jgi:hypothetical protein
MKSYSVDLKNELDEVLADDGTQLHQKPVTILLNCVR